ncbi:hypothetical protein NM688_g9159 [Phlebia brevispora]|uniref:Uncharacterized protein n=1 Tax=Phlebia brevispora TaxID=194682 RepID=A0ACC1RK07_9APHY|nr:hypothetical protein NM688_g9159 [Phlebia brevispora]
MPPPWKTNDLSTGTRCESATASGISRLPDELLLNIFLIVSNISRHGESCFNVLRLAHTCSLWRKILLAYGEPWSKLPSWDFMANHVEFTDFIVERSLDIPLTLLSSDSVNPQAWETRFLQTYMSRLRNLEITSSSYDVANRSPYIDILETSAAPEIRTFKLNLMPTEFDNNSGKDFILSHLFAHRATKLDTLSFRWSRLTYTATNYLDLVSLHLELFSLRRKLNESGSILTAITNSPRLKELAIMVHNRSGARRDDWDPMLDEDQTLRHRLALEYMTCLKLEMALPYMLLILGSITLPNPHALDHIALYPFKLSATSRRYYKVTDVLSQDYLPPGLLDGLYDWNIGNYWDSPRDAPGLAADAPPELFLSMKGRGIAAQNRHHYVVDIDLPGVEDSTQILERFSGLAAAKQLRYWYNAGDSDKDTFDRSNHLRLSSILHFAQSLRSLDLWIDTSLAIYSDDSFPPFYGDSRASVLDSVRCADMEELEICFSTRWTLDAFRELATFCKRLPCLRRLTVMCQRYAYFDERNDYHTVVRALRRLGIPYATNDTGLGLGIGVRSLSMSSTLVAAPVNLKSFLSDLNDDGCGHFTSAFAHVHFINPYESYAIDPSIF